MNGVITNPDKYQAMILGHANYTLNFKVNETSIPVKDNIDLLEVSVDKNLQFKSYIFQKFDTFAGLEIDTHLKI